MLSVAGENGARPGRGVKQQKVARGGVGDKDNGGIPITTKLVTDEEARMLVSKHACATCRKRKKRCLHFSFESLCAPETTRIVPAIKPPTPGAPAPNKGAQAVTKRQSHGSAALTSQQVRPLRPKKSSSRAPALEAASVADGSPRRVIACADCRRKKQRCPHFANGTSNTCPRIPNKTVAPTAPDTSAPSSAVKRACSSCRARKKRCPHVVFPSGAPVRGSKNKRLSSPFKPRLGDKSRLDKLSLEQISKRQADRNRKRAQDATSASSSAATAPASVAATCKVATASGTLQWLDSTPSKSLPAQKKRTSSTVALGCEGERGIRKRLAACDKCRQRRIRCFHMYNALADDGSAGADDKQAHMHTLNHIFKSSKCPINSSQMRKKQKAARVPAEDSLGVDAGMACSDGATPLNAQSSNLPSPAPGGGGGGGKDAEGSACVGGVGGGKRKVDDAKCIGRHRGFISAVGCFSPACIRGTWAVRSGEFDDLKIYQATGV
jgi:hypothetical protein